MWVEPPVFHPVEKTKTKKYQKSQKRLDPVVHHALEGKSSLT